jgi:hypothetical protein
MIRSLKEINFAIRVIKAYRKAIEESNTKAFINIMSKSFKYDLYFKEDQRRQFLQLHALGIEKFLEG